MFFMKRFEIKKGEINISFIEYASDFSTHTHSCMEIVYILEGEVMQSINNARIQTGKGSLILMDRNCMHSLEIIKPLKYVNILFDEIEDIPFDDNYISTTVDEAIHSLIFDMLEESEQKKPGYAHIMKGKLEILVGRIIRADKRVVKNENATDEYIKYIKEHCTENLKLEDVSRRFNLSPSYFSQLLKDKYGYSFKQILIQKRLMEVMNRLFSGDECIEEIYQSCGFSNKSYFYKQFYEWFGVKPSFIRDYKNSHEKYKNLWNKYR